MTSRQEILGRFSVVSVPKKKVEEVIVEKKVDVNSSLKAPICSFMGHVDAGKTSLMDIIRNTNLQSNEAGGITQSIGSSFVDIEDIVETTNVINGKFEVKPEIPGLIIIDTPGHEAFNSLRERGSSLCDIAVLVVDMIDGVKPQTIESIKLLREKKVPFVIAATKLDRVYNYKTTDEISLRKAFKKQTKDVVSMIESSLYDMQYDLEKEDIKAQFYFKNKNPQKIYSIVPISSKTKEGLADLLSLIVYISQNWMNKKIVYNEEVDASIMECVQDKKHGWVLDVILKNGTIKIGDEFGVSGKGGERVVKVRKLLVKNKKKFDEVESIRASSGVRILGSNCDNCFSGTKLHPLELGGLELAKKEVESIWDKMPMEKVGVCIQAPTISNLDALHQLLTKEKVPIMSINLRTLNEKDLDKLLIKIDEVKDLEFKCLLYFGKVDNKEKETYTKLCKDRGIHFINSEIVYGLIEEYLNFKKDCLENRQKEQIAEGNAVYPCKLRILKDHVYMKGGNKELLLGVKVRAGRLRIGSPLYVVVSEHKNKGKIINMKTEREFELGKVTSIQKNNEDKDLANLHDEVCIRIDNPNELSYDRHFDHKDEIISRLTRESIDILKKDYRGEMTKDDWKLVIEMKNILKIK